MLPNMKVFKVEDAVVIEMIKKWSKGAFFIENYPFGLLDH